jgi:very-short-patch-repair endonuclease
LTWATFAPSSPVTSITEAPRRSAGALAIYEPPRLTRSEFEREFVARAEEMGLPSFATNFNEEGYELDVYWPELRFAVELDVYATHGGHEPFEEDRRRDEDLKLAGIELTRVTARRFECEPRQAMERVQRLLEQRRRQLGSDNWTAAGEETATQLRGAAR